MKTKFFLSPALLKKCKIFITLVLASCFAMTAKADYTIASGSNVNATAITGQSGILTINGTLTINSNVSLSNFSTIIINGPNGQIYWSNNSDLTLNAAVTVTINSGAPGLQPTGGNASKRLIIGTTTIAVSNDNANNAAFSFAEFNAAGGLPQFILTTSVSAICSNSSFTATITPLNNTVNYDCTWTISSSGTKSPGYNSNFNTAQTSTISPTSSGTYTVSCTLYKAGDGDPITTKTKTVTVNAQPSAPTPVTASSTSICVGSSINIKATSSGNTIQWYTVSSAGTSIGSSASAVDYSVAPTANTTYYAESKNASGCVSSTRASVSVTVSPNSVGGTVSGNANVCAGSNSSTLILGSGTYTGSIIRWESSTNNFATAGTTISSTNQSITVSNLSATTYYRAVVTSGVCTSANSSVAVLTVSNPGTWLGVNTDWNSTLNWCNGTIPTSSTNVTIPTGLTNYPIITGTALANNVTVATGGSASITVSGTLKISGVISSTNGINATAGTIELGGSTAQTIRADYFTSGKIANFKISNTKTSASAANPSVAINAAGGMFNVSGQVSFGNLNNAYLQTNDQLTLLSSSIATASIADITNNNVNTGNSIAGKIVIERYIPGRRSWRLLSAPVTAASQVKISNSWQEGAARVTNPSIINSTNNPHPGYGTHVNYGSPAANGYDQGPNGNSNIYYMTSTGWNGVPTATNNGVATNSGYITDQPGYMLFVRGDRSTQLSSGTGAATTATVLRMKGNINTGLLSLNIGAPLIVGSSKFRILSNPYPSAINFHKLIANSGNSGGGFADAFYLWDPTITGSNGVGGWVALSYNNATGLYDRNVAGSGVSNNGDIQSGTAFVINYTGSATSLQVKESNKSSLSNNAQFRPNSKVNQLRINLLAKNPDNTISVNDGVLVSYDESYNNDVDNADMKKMSNFSENLGITKGESSLAIEKRNLILNNDSIGLKITKMKQKNYQLEVVMNDLAMPEGSIALLQDKYLSSEKILNDAETNVYDFNINGNASSSDTARFKMLFKRITEYKNVNAELINEDAMIKWKVNYEFYMDHYEIEKSIDGTVFNKVANITADSALLNEYNWLDKSPETGVYYYRIKAIAKNGTTLYSEKVDVKVINNRTGMFVFPNPVTGKSLQLQMNNLKAGTYYAKFQALTGETITTFNIKYNGGGFSKNVLIPSSITPGIYLLKITSGSGEKNIIKVLISQH